ncbi:ABC transporter ATP-binding protein [Thermodesulfobacteriota bacterium B35]
MGTVIELEQVCKRYGRITALAGIDLAVAQGELFAYLGPNGAGKSTTIRILTGLTRMSSGRVRLNGFDIEREPMAARRQFGVVHQHLNLDQELSVFENMDLHGQLFGMERRSRRQRIEELLASFGLADRARTLVRQLSGGLRRRVTTARALLHQPEILFLDEPTTGLDAAIRRRIRAMIREVQARGTTIFLTTHQIEEAEFLAGRVAFLDQGRIVALDSPAGLMRQVGSWAIDQLREGRLVTSYFASRQEAAAFRSEDGFTLRRVNLEDAFLALTGRKVHPEEGR